MTIGGTLFFHDGFSLDYCIEAALDSLLAFCDEVVVVDAESEDGTREWLQDRAHNDHRLKIIDGRWDKSRGLSLMADLANQAREALSTDWHFALQADEVVHQDSFPAIRAAMQSGHRKIFCTRINFFRDASHYVRNGSEAQPVTVEIVRLAERVVQAVGDAETLENWDACKDFTDRITIHHYGFIRDQRVHLRKCIESQRWLLSYVDERLLACQKYGEYRPECFVPESELEKFLGTHPIYALEWLSKRGY